VKNGGQIYFGFINPSRAGSNLNILGEARYFSTADGMERMRITSNAAIRFTQPIGTDFLMDSVPGGTVWRWRMTNVRGSTLAIGNDVGGTFSTVPLTMSQDGAVAINAKAISAWGL